MKAHSVFVIFVMFILLVLFELTEKLTYLNYNCFHCQWLDLKPPPSSLHRQGRFFVLISALPVLVFLGEWTFQRVQGDHKLKVSPSGLWKIITLGLVYFWLNLAMLVSHPGHRISNRDYCTIWTLESIHFQSKFGCSPIFTLT